MSTHNFETFSYTPSDLAATMSGTVQDTLIYLNRHNYLTDDEFDHLSNTLAVYAMPNRKGFGKRLLERFFGNNQKENVWVFPIVEIDPMYTNSSRPIPRDTTDTDNVVDINSFKKDSD